MFYSYYSFFFKYIFFCAPNQFMAVQFIIVCAFVFLPCNNKVGFILNYYYYESKKYI